MGQLGFWRMDIVYNAQGLSQSTILYNGTGLGWEHGATFELLSTGGIPGFSFLYLAFSLTALMGLFILDRHLKIH